MVAGEIDGRSYARQRGSRLPSWPPRESRSGGVQCFGDGTKITFPSSVWLFPGRVYDTTVQISNPPGLFSGPVLFVGVFPSFYVEVQL